MTDKKAYVDLLVKGGLERKSAISTVDTIVDRVSKAMKGESAEDQDTVIRLKLNDILKGANAEKFRGLCIALDEMRDSLQYQKYLTLEAYKEDAARAIADKKVKVDGDKIIPLDTREFFDEERTKKNKNFGKPLPTVMRREAYFLIDGKVVRTFGDFKAELGKVYDIFGTMNDKGILNVSKTPEIRYVEAVKEKDLWEMVYNAASEAGDITVSLVDVKTLDKGTPVITKGYLQHMQVTSNGSTMIVLSDDEETEGVIGFTATEDLATEAQTFQKGTELIVLGRVMQSGDRPKGLVITGAFKNPASKKISEYMKTLDDIELP